MRTLLLPALLAACLAGASALSGCSEPPKKPALVVDPTPVQAGDTVKIAGEGPYWQVEMVGKDGLLFLIKTGHYQKYDKDGLVEWYQTDRNRVWPGGVVKYKVEDR
jgi:hypothetical protein